MRPQRTQPAESGIITAHGHGLKIRVENRHLVIDDGFGRQRRSRRYHRTSKLRRLVIIGSSGYVTLDALRALRDMGAAFLHIDSGGELVATSTVNGPDFAALRRAQALAADGPAGLEIARHVLTLKVEGQRSLLDELPAANYQRGALECALAEIQDGHALRMLLAAEAGAASFYWEAWSTIPVPFPARDLAKVPEHWRTFGQRSSLITGGPRTATNPANAILNYLYALLEAEAIVTCQAVGLDPGVGVFHLDRRGRASLGLDLLEAVRPVVDGYLLALLTQRTLSAREFVETREGACRISPRLAAELAGTCEVWRSHVAPVVELAAHILAEHSASKIPSLTPLTHRNWKQAWDQRSPARKVRRSRGEFAVLPSTCRDCGAPLSDHRRRYCDECRTRRFAEQAVAAREKGFEVLAQLRAEQRDPAHGGQAAEIRGRKNAAHQAALKAWSGERPDPEVFRTEILPGLRHLRIAELVAATGLSPDYCSMVRLGKKVPHARHWNALRTVATSQADRRSIDEASCR